MEENKFSGAKVWMSIIALIIVLAGITYFVRNDKDYGTTLVPGVTGVQGVVMSVDPGTKQFVLEQKKVSKNEDGTFAVEEKTYTVSWGDDTVFKTYQDVASLNSDTTMAAQANNLAQYKNVIITPSKMSDKDKTISAQEIRILPNLTN